jgi:hypothetical protein
LCAIDAQYFWLQPELEAWDRRDSPTLIEWSQVSFRRMNHRQSKHRLDFYKPVGLHWWTCGDESDWVWPGLELGSFDLGLNILTITTQQQILVELRYRVIMVWWEGTWGKVAKVMGGCLHGYYILRLELIEERQQRWWCWSYTHRDIQCLILLGYVGKERSAGSKVAKTRCVFPHGKVLSTSSNCWLDWWKETMVYRRDVLHFSHQKRLVS